MSLTLFLATGHVFKWKAIQFEVKILGKYSLNSARVIGVFHVWTFGIANRQGVYFLFWCVGRIYSLICRGSPSKKESKLLVYLNDCYILFSTYFKNLSRLSNITQILYNRSILTSTRFFEICFESFPNIFRK